MSAAWESLVAEIEEKLLTLSAPELTDVCSTLNVTVDESDRDLPRKLRRLILQHVESKDVTGLEDGGMSLLLKLNDKLDELKEENDGCDEAPQGKAALSHRPVAGDGTAPDKSDEESECISAPNLKEPVTIPIRNAGFAHPLYRRDLKIIGQIGEPNQKDKLGYASLERQIRRALKKGYDEGEVVEAVIQAIVPGIKLKSYLESRVDLTLPALRQILRTHYIEKDATELYHSLTRVVQDPRGEE